MLATVEYATIAAASANNPRNDTASVVELEDGALLAVWHKYDGLVGSDFDLCRIYAKSSYDGGMTWERERMLIDNHPEDHNVQAPGLCRLPSGELLLHCLRGHSGGSSSTMEVYVSRDGGEFWEFRSHIWTRTNGQWLQGGANHMNVLSGGRLLLPYHFGSGHQGDQHNTVGCYFSDDQGATWTRSKDTVDLPMRGAMEASVAERTDGWLVMSLRSQLGSVFISLSHDGGNSWSPPQSSGLKSPESCTCLRAIPGTNALLLLWNDSMYQPDKHHFGRRTPLSAAVSEDGGATWSKIGNIAEGPYEFTNLNCMFTRAGKAVITYMQVEDPAFYESGDPPFKRNGMNLNVAVIDRNNLIEIE
ncbi:glycoside hydrolase [Paenibacillus sp. J5C_2022]|uniref:sialidase family protein n=1 Tax=Paenibacillus sp. J5C2022 TaxID=2977129 RepID=UPI0021D01C02|nr:sialidase family protein [Paenibacillus sp. J5C2022]MCU6711923.1 glycoside hydrolase [Paenibacillus sp. J5C2022]